MESRMEKYYEPDLEDFQRSKKNADLYKEVYGSYDDFEDIVVPDNTNEVEIDNINTIVGNRASRMKKNNIEMEELPEIDEEVGIETTEKVHDINTLLEKAKEENAKVKKENPINRNVPNYLANLESDTKTKELISKYNGVQDDDLPILKEVKYVTSEISLEDKKINTASLSLDILSDLKPSGNTFISGGFKEEEIDKSEEEEKKEFYTGNININEDDFEEDDEEFIPEKKSHIFLKVMLLIIGFASLFVALYFILREYTNLF